MQHSFFPLVYIPLRKSENTAIFNCRILLMLRYMPISDMLKCGKKCAYFLKVEEEWSLLSILLNYIKLTLLLEYIFWTFKFYFWVTSLFPNCNTRTRDYCKSEQKFCSTIIDCHSGWRVHTRQFLYLEKYNGESISKFLGKLYYTVMCV